MHESVRGKFSFTCGPARGGKSTFAAKWQSEPGERPRVVVDSDYIRQNLYGDGHHQGLESHVYHIRVTMIRTLLSQGYDVLCDDTHTTEFSIRNNFKIDPNAEVILLLTPESVCIERAHATNQSYLVQPIKRMWLNIHKLARQSGWQTEDFNPYSGGVSPFSQAVQKRIEQIRKDVINNG